MKLKDLVDYNLVENEEGSSIIPMFEITDKRWDELSAMVSACFDSCRRTSEAMKMFDKHFELNSQREAVVVLVMFTLEQGRVNGENIVREHGESLLMLGRFERMRRSARWLKEQGIALSNYLRETITRLLIYSVTNGTLHKAGNEEHISTDDERHPYTNKNKFKEDEFEIPDPNEPNPPEEGDK